MSEELKLGLVNEKMLTKAKKEVIKRMRSEFELT